MLKQQTTFIVGAGASCELGFPSGDALRSQITDLAAPSSQNAYGLRDDRMVDVVKSRLNHANTVFAGGLPGYYTEAVDRIKAAAGRIHRGLPLALSIDNFLYTHQGDDDVVQFGKAAIALCILRAEAQCALFDAQTPVALRLNSGTGARLSTNIFNERMAGTWYPAFARLLMSGVERQDASSIFDNVRFVVFNYDRCLEHYLWAALQAHFDISSEAASQAMSKAVFLHPYGSLGPLPWQNGTTTEKVDLGHQNGMNVWQIGTRLKTFTESADSDTESRVKEAIASASTLVFLGFGFLDQNIQLLRPETKCNARRLMLTLYGVSGEDQSIVRQVLAGFAKHEDPQWLVEPGACKSLFERFRLQLSLG